MELNVEKLEAHRNVLDENPREFANRIGVSHTWYYAVMSGKHSNAGLLTITIIANSLGISAKDLIK